MGVVDVGAGTGIETEVLVRESSVPVHAVEPCRAMRTPLLARIARLPACSRARVTVHPCPAEETGLRHVADLAVASNVIPCVPPAGRRAIWHAIANALAPGGLLLFDPPPAHPALPGRWSLPPVQVGPDVYRADVTSTPHNGAQRLRFTYRVHREGRVVREEHEDFTPWPTHPAVITREPTSAGLIPVPTPHPDLRAAVLPAWRPEK